MQKNREGELWKKNYGRKIMEELGKDENYGRRIM